MKNKNFDPNRIRQIQEWLLQGQLVTDILRNIIQKWVLDEKAGLEYIASAFEEFSRQTEQSYEKVRAYHIQLRLNLYKKAMDDKQYDIALRVLQDLAKLEDLN
jgi:hypothetical protein